MRPLDVDTLRQWLDSGRRVTVVDIRSPEEFAESHVPGSINVFAYDALKAGDAHALDGFSVAGGGPVVAVCGRGRIATIASEVLRARGVDALTLAGGMHAWSAAWNTADVPLASGTAEIVQVRRSAKGCLSYVVAEGGAAAIIDPSLGPHVYVNLCRERGWTISHVLDTHIHADHLSRAKTLAELTGAILMLPRTDRVRFVHRALDDGARLRLGSAEIVALRTPGHTPESTTYLVDNAAAITGDTLFLASVGRPDLHGDGQQVTAAAHDLYRSLRKVAEFGSDTLILPGHVAGVVAFDHLPLVARLADVRSSNPLFDASESDFVGAITGRILPTPPNYHRIVELNEAGAPLPADPLELEAGANRCAAT